MPKIAWGGPPPAVGLVFFNADATCKQSMDDRNSYYIVPLRSSLLL